MPNSLYSNFFFKAPCQDGKVQLAGNSMYSNFGRLEICINGTWGKVCGVNATNKDASVVCRQLGLSPHGNSILYCSIV